jgi:hypothetical protein
MMQYKVVYEVHEVFDDVENARKFRDSIGKDDKVKNISLKISSVDPFGDHFDVNSSSAEVKNNEIHPDSAQGQWMKRFNTNDVK